MAKASPEANRPRRKVQAGEETTVE